MRKDELTHEDRKKYKYWYFVAYATENGWGQIEIGRTNPLNTYSEIMQMREYVMSVTNLKNIVIVNWKKIRG